MTVSIMDPRSVRSAWQSLSSLFKRGRRRGMQAELRLKLAYQAVFRGNPGREDQAIVLADLANKAGFYRATAAKGTTDQELWQIEGARLHYGQTVFANLELPQAEMQALEQAARMEAAVDSDPHEQQRTN